MWYGALGCASAPAVQDPVALLTLAEEHVDRGEAAEARALLDGLGEDDFDGERRERYLVAYATSLARTGDLWDGFELIRDFSDDYPHSQYVTTVQDLEFEIGSNLMRSDGGFLFFTSDRDDGQIVLEHFMVRWKHPAMADALRLLGEKAFAEGDYELAKERFRTLLLEHENSEWVPLALFRTAMAWFHSLEGPAYDLRSLRRAHDELQTVVARDIENPTFHTEASAALATVREWLGTKHLLIAEFYTTVGNARGAQRHLAVLRDQFPDTDAAQRIFGTGAEGTP